MASIGSDSETAKEPEIQRMAGPRQEVTEEQGSSNKHERRERWKRREARLVHSRLMWLYLVTAQRLKNAEQ